MINIGMMAKHYGVLPSQVREHATTYDLMIERRGMSWEQMQQDKANGKPTAPKLSQEQLADMLAKTKNPTKESS
jgi:hypothetical protein